MRLEEMRRPPSGQGEADPSQEDRLSDASTEGAMSQVSGYMRGITAGDDLYLCFLFCFV